jgi:hypothetical protein
MCVFRPRTTREKALDPPGRLPSHARSPRGAWKRHHPGRGVVAKAGAGGDRTRLTMSAMAMSLPWPRLPVLRNCLMARPERIHDGPVGGWGLLGDGRCLDRLAGLQVL